MVINTWSEVVLGSFQGLWAGVIAFVPNLIVALFLVILGWIIGALFGRVVAQIFKTIKADEALKTAGVDDVLRRGGINLNSGAFVGALVKWFFVVVFLVAAFDVLRLDRVTEFLQQVVLLYLPQVIIAVLILLVAGVLGDVMKKIVSASSKTAGIRSANLLASLTKWAIWIFGILVALSQLGIAEAFIQTVFTGVVVAFSLALGLSFGLGGQDAAARFIEKTREEISSKE